MAEDIKAAVAAKPPAPVVLAYACRGFVIGGVGSSLLYDYAIVRRDNYAVCDDYCHRTAMMLRDVLGSQLIRRYANGTSDAEIGQLADAAEAELREYTVEDIDHIGGALITLGVTLQEITNRLAHRPELPSTIRGAARVAADSAKILWSHYGGDSGGW
ncbi:hypothetical protein [Actinoallomurus sp. NPDC052274]|uniref:hypothetical protein n=1 Tax=Actinoallomurus sp. NPDC052274 TaxID=3155420 RepID=UPI00343D0817